MTEINIEMNRKKIVHFVIDDKFIIPEMNIFDSLEEYDNEYILIKNIPFQRRVYLKVKEKIREMSRWEVKKRICRNDYADVIILHSLFSLPLDLFKHIHPKTKVVWLAWGYDLYHGKYGMEPLIKISSLYGSYTKEYMDAQDYQPKLPSLIKSKIREFVSMVLWPATDSILNEALRRIDYFGGYPGEYNLIERNGCFRAENIDYSYPLISNLYSKDNIENFSDDMPGNILVGNSATETNNHIDVFVTIEKIVPADKRIIVPLSYGSHTYREYVISKGCDIFAEQFQPLVDYMPLTEYQLLLQSCSVAIFGHERQQAVGNVIMSLWNGAKVFLSENSIVYKYLRSQGLILYTIQNDLNKDTICDSLSRKEILSNRKIVSNNFSNEAVLRKVEVILKNALN